MTKREYLEEKSKEYNALLKKILTFQAEQNAKGKRLPIEYQREIDRAYAQSSSLFFILQRGDEVSMGMFIENTIRDKEREIERLSVDISFYSILNDKSIVHGLKERIVKLNEELEILKILKQVK